MAQIQIIKPDRRPGYHYRGPDPLRPNRPEAFRLLTMPVRLRPTLECVHPDPRTQLQTSPDLVVEMHVVRQRKER